MSQPYRAAAVTLGGTWTNPTANIAFAISHLADEPSEIFHTEYRFPAMDIGLTDDEWLKEMLVNLLENL